MDKILVFRDIVSLGKFTNLMICICKKYIIILPPKIFLGNGKNKTLKKTLIPKKVA